MENKMKNENVSDVHEFDGYQLIDHELTEEELQERIKKYHDTCKELGLGNPLNL